MPYNLSLISNSTGYVGLLNKVNDTLMFGMFGIGLLLTIGSILYISFYKKTQDNAGSFGAAAFICAILSLMMYAMNFLPDYAVITTWMIAALAGAALYFRD